MRGAGRAGLGLAGLLVTLLVLSPYVVMLLTALKPAAELRTSPPRLTPVLWHWQSFTGVLHDPDFRTWLRVSLVVAVASTVLVLLAAVPAAYHTARHRFRGRQAFLFLVLVTQMFSPTALVVGLHREFFELDLVNTYAALILTNAAFNLAFAVWILRAFFASIPREI
jgi:multiple sugar transport system permease protein